MADEVDDFNFDPNAGTRTGVESSLSNWAGPYVTDMLGKGKALSELPYQMYGGPLTAGASDLQQKAFSGLGSLTMPEGTFNNFTPGSYTDAGMASKYMTPYLDSALEPQIAEARRQAEIQRNMEAGRMTRAGSFGGGRSAIMEAENSRNLLRNIKDIYGTGTQQAFESGRNQFNTEQQLGLAANNQNRQGGIDYLNLASNLGGVQRGIEQEGIMADIDQFQDERDFPYKQVQFQQSLLQGLPVATESYSYAQPTGLGTFMSGAGAWNTLSDLLNWGGD